MLLNRLGAIGQASAAFGVDISKFYSNAQVKEVRILSSKIELIPGNNEDKPAPKSWTIYNKGPEVIYLFVGDAEIASYPLPRGMAISNDDHGGLGNKISAIAEKETLAIVTIQGNFDKKEKTFEMLIKPLIFTGENIKTPYGEQYKKLSSIYSNYASIIGQEHIDALLSSDDGLKGWKFFEMCNSQPGETYDFIVETENPDIDLETIKCSAIDLTTKAALDMILQIITLQVRPGEEADFRNHAWRLRQKVSVAKNKQFSITPDGSSGMRFFGLWGKDPNSSYENALIWNLSNNNKFTILGF